MNNRGVPNTEDIQRHFQDIKDILIGSLLGNASLQTYSDGKTWRLRYLQKDELYLRHLYKLWENFTGTGPKYIEDKQGNGRWYFNTKVYSGFTEIAHSFYKKNEKGLWVKRIPENIDLTPRALAYWYMDNGSKKQNAQAYYLCTDCFTKSELDILKNVIFRHWGIMANYHRTEKNKLRLYIPTRCGGQFESLLKGYVIESMKSKL